jgi:osmotically inducible protein OsmC
MPTRHAHARWEGSIKEGQGTVKLGSGSFEGPYSFGSRFESAKGTNPEELLGAAHAGCFAMALSLMLGEAGHPPDYIEADADVSIDANELKVTSSHLRCRAKVPGMDAATFNKTADAAKENCPVSKALAGVEITLEAELVS